MSNAQRRTPFGIFMAKLRIDHDESMKQMGERMECTQNYLSVVELGKRPVPKDWHKRIVLAYGLSFEQELFLEAAITQSDATRRNLSAKKLIDEIEDMSAEANIQYTRNGNMDWYAGYCEALEDIEKKIRNGEFNT